MNTGNTGNTENTENEKVKSLIITIVVLAGVIAAAVIIYTRLGGSASSNLQVLQPTANVALSSGEAPEQPSAETPNPHAAFDFTVTDSDGNQISLYDVIARGKPIVLNFWASWCGPCKSEMPDFNAASVKYSGEVEFMMVNLTDGSRETTAVAKSFIENNNYTFPVYFDTQSSAATAYGVMSIPTTYFIDAQGSLVARASGAISATSLEEGIGMIKGE